MFALNPSNIVYTILLRRGCWQGGVTCGRTKCPGTVLSPEKPVRCSYYYRYYNYTGDISASSYTVNIIIISGYHYDNSIMYRQCTRVCITYRVRPAHARKPINIRTIFRVVRGRRRNSPRVYYYFTIIIILILHPPLYEYIMLYV